MLSTLGAGGCTLGVRVPSARSTHLPGPPAAVEQATPAPCGPLSGRWVLTLRIPTGQPFAGQYRGALELTQRDHALEGRVGHWSNGASSRVAGLVHRGQVTLLRVDVAPWTGFRAVFTGRLLPDGSLAGTFQNDPTAPHGNGAQGTWYARRDG